MGPCHLKLAPVFSDHRAEGCLQLVQSLLDQSECGLELESRGGVFDIHAG